MQQSRNLAATCTWTVRRRIVVIASIFLGGVATAIVATIGLLLCEPCGVTNRIINRVYKNVSPPIDREMPVTTTPFPSSPNVVEIIGGRGEGLDCSIPWFAKPIFPRYFLGDKPSPVTRRFHQACVFHDLCYRHGLATYGYSQADCDLMLQEQAFRICSYLPSKKGDQSCQLDAKKVLAGVTLGGAESYRNWEQSTFFEFDPHPYKSQRFIVNRVIDKPFAPSDFTIDPAQWLLTFDIKPSGIEVKCANCPRREFSVGELAEADAIVGNATFGPLKLDPVNGPLVWLPLRHSMSAPQLLSVSDRQQYLAWLSRKEFHNTVFCLVAADPRKLLTHTRVDSWGCTKTATTRLALTPTDLFSPAPFLVAIHGNETNGGKPGIFATALSPQKAPYAKPCSPDKKASLRLYKSSELIAGSRWTQSQPDCLLDEKEASIGDFGLFQYAPIIKENQHIFLSRSLHETDKSEARDGASPADDLRVTILDINIRDGAGNVSTTNRYISASHLHDMMLPATKSKDDLRVLSIVAPREREIRRTGGQLRLYETNLKSDMAPKELDIHWDPATKLMLDRSWARRPINIVETAAPAPGQPPKTDLVFSRSRLSKSLARPGLIIFEFLILRRNREGEGRFTAVRSARCTVQYVNASMPGHPACRRVEPADSATREALQTRLQGAQLLSGHFGKDRTGSFDLALHDACASSRPMVFKSDGGTFIAEDGLEPLQGRSMNCLGALDAKSIGVGIVDAD